MSGLSKQNSGLYSFPFPSSFRWEGPSEKGIALLTFFTFFSILDFTNSYSIRLQIAISRTSIHEYCSSISSMIFFHPLSFPPLKYHTNTYIVLLSPFLSVLVTKLIIKKGLPLGYTLISFSSFFLRRVIYNLVAE